MTELSVALGERSYPIIIEEGCLSTVGQRLGKMAIGNRYAVVGDDRVLGLYGDQLEQVLAGSGLHFEFFSFPHGEASKQISSLERLARSMAAKGFDRRSAIVGFGGGVTGDLAGFLASTYMRGIPFVQIPTTLLAQVDSSVGGKTGVDIPEGKNLLGTFYQPQAVFIDIGVLRTLDRAEFLGGLAEVIKYGVIWDRAFFDFLKIKRESILALEPSTLSAMIAACCRIKAEVVAIDEREGDLRRILNFGHTIGHAVESESNYEIIHGVAVAMGMAAASRLAVLTGVLEAEQCAEIVSLLADYGLPTSIPPELDRGRIKGYLKTDKKTIGGVVNFVLPTRIGKTIISANVSEEHLDQVLVS